MTEQFVGVGQQLVESPLRASVAVVGAVAETNHPVAGMTQVIGGFLGRLGRDRRQLDIARLRQRRPQLRLPGAVQQVAHHREGIAGALAAAFFDAAVGQLAQRESAEFARPAKIGERVFVASLAFDHSRELEQRRGLPDEVEGEVGRRDVLLEDGAVAAPFGEPVPEHQPVVTEPEQVLEQGIRDRAPTRAGDGEGARACLTRRDTAGFAVLHLFGAQKTLIPRGTE